MKKIVLTLVAAACCLSSSAQRHTDVLDRGLVAVPSGQGNFVSWRIFGEEYYDTEYNLYRNGVKLNQTPLKVSNYTDTGGSSSSKYQVAAVVRGVEQEKSGEVTRWTQNDGSNYYLPVNMQPVTNRSGAIVTGNYIINDVSLGDVTGDGISEFFVKRNYTAGVNASGNTTNFHHYECYNIKGERLWWIDLGPNMMAGPDEQWDLVAFDWDEDGKAECVMRGADNMIIHTATGKTINIGKMNYYAPRDEYTHQGNEYLLYLNGETGEPYAWDGKDNWTPQAYPLPRFESGESDYATAWGAADTGHRSSKHYFGAPCLDGRHHSIFLGRGCYTRHKMCALDVNPTTHELTQRWRWDNNGGWSDPWFGNGFHNFAIADTDWDGRDEIVFGSMIIDDNGKGLCTTGLGHGDAQHCSDLDPYRHGQEQFTCNEDEPACTFYNATTGQIYYRWQSNSDDGRALCANFSNEYPGSMGRSTQTGMVSCTADKVVGELGDYIAWSDLNFRIYWDGDLLDEVLNSPGTEREAVVIKPGSGRIFQTTGCKMNNDSKNNPSAQGDIMGDWREEIVVRSSDNSQLRIYTTTAATKHRIYTLWHDHQYRNAMVWQCVGYNQPPHPSFFLGELEGITIAPPPFTMTGRREVANGGTIGSSMNNEHVIVCEPNDTKITVEEGTSPWVATFNVPSWVQGTNSSQLNGKAAINRQYYTCTVEGGAFSGSMHLAKQGDGTLVLPAVEQHYTGETNVWAGTLSFDGKLLHSPLWLNRFAQLSSNGGQFQSISMSYDSKLLPGGDDQRGTITADSLALGFGARVVFDLYNDGLQADQLNLRAMSIETKSWQYGPEYLQPVFEFRSHGAEGEETATGRYLIGAVSNIDGDIDNIITTGLGNKLKTTLKAEDGKLYLDVESTRQPASILWTGAASGFWNLADDANFTIDGQSDFFVSGDNVVFDDSAEKTTVSLKGDLEPDTAMVNSSKGYTFTGNGHLVGNAVLVKQGTGMLTIRTDNSYTGGNRLSGGTVVVNQLANQYQAKGNLGGVITNAANFIMENGAELRNTANVNNGSAIRFEGEEGGIINTMAAFVVSRSMSGTQMTKKGAGTMQLTVSNSQLNRMVIAGGTVQCVGDVSTPAKTVEFQGGTLNTSRGTSHAIEVAKNKTGTLNTVNDATYSNTISGEGTLTISCPVRSGGSGSSKWYATRTRLQLKFAGFKGTLKPTSNGDPSGRFTLDTSTGMPDGIMNIAAGVLVQNTGKTFRIGRLQGSGSLGGNSDFGSGTSGTNTWQIGNDDNWSFSGKVTANAILTKVGSGKVTWNGANDNTGATNVNEGELQLSSSSMLGTGALTVGTEGTLSGTNKQSTPLNNSSVTIRGTLRPGTTATSTTGTLYFNNKNLTLGTTGTLAINASRCATDNATGCTTISGVKTLTLNGTIRITTSATHQLQVGDSIRIFTATTVSGTPQFEMVGDVEWDTSRISEGLLFVKAVGAGIADIVSPLKPRNIYDVNGRLVRPAAVSTEGLPAGIYICEGRKFVVR